MLAVLGLGILPLVALGFTISSIDKENASSMWNCVSFLLHFYLAVRTWRVTMTLFKIYFKKAEEDYELWHRFPARIIHETDPDTKIVTRADIFQFFWTLCLKPSNIISAIG